MKQFNRFTIIQKPFIFTLLSNREARVILIYTLKKDLLALLKQNKKIEMIKNELAPNIGPFVSYNKCNNIVN